MKCQINKDKFLIQLNLGRNFDKLDLVKYDIPENILGKLRNKKIKFLKIDFYKYISIKETLNTCKIGVLSVLTRNITNELVEFIQTNSAKKLIINIQPFLLFDNDILNNIHNLIKSCLKNKYYIGFEHYKNRKDYYVFGIQQISSNFIKDLMIKYKENWEKMKVMFIARYKEKNNVFSEGLFEYGIFKEILVLIKDLSLEPIGYERFKI